MQNRIDRHRISVRAFIERDDHILMVAFDDENGFHYNLPGGGVEEGENLFETLKREAWEEACARVEIGELLLVLEFVPELDDGTYGQDHRDLGLIFRGKLQPGCEPCMPETPDYCQVGVEWVHKDDFPNVMLYPRVNQLLLERLKAQDLAGAFTREI